MQLIQRTCSEQRHELTDVADSLVYRKDKTKK